MSTHAGRNTAPLHFRNIEPDKASRIAEDYNGWSTYHPDVNNEAFTHLKDLHASVEQLHASTQHPFAEVATHHAALAGQSHSDKDNASALDYVSSAQGVLHGMKNDPSIMKELHPAIDRAIGHAQAYLDKFTPARVQKSKNTGSVSVTIDPSFRARADVELNKSKANGDRWRGYATHDALFQKVTLPAEAAKRAKGYKKPAKPAGEQ